VAASVTTPVCLPQAHLVLLPQLAEGMGDEVHLIGVCRSDEVSLPFFHSSRLQFPDDCFFADFNSHLLLHLVKWFH